jgi:hypothetical protein
MPFPRICACHSFILAKQTGCFAPLMQVQRRKHRRDFAFLSGVALAKTDVRHKAADKFKPPASRVVVDLKKILKP